MRARGLDPRAAAVDRSLRTHIIAAAALAIGLGGGIGAWAASTEIAGAVIAPGEVVVETSVKAVQHPTGGVVGEILVREGDAVAEGQTLMRLDETLTRANLAIVEAMLDELAARQTRLLAERDGVADLVFPEALLARAAADPARAATLSSERRLFELRREAREGEKARLAERAAQLDDEIVGIELQVEAKGRELDLILRELEGLRALFAKNLVPVTRVVALEREEARLSGERGQLLAAAAQARGRISEIGLQTIQIDQALRSEVARELREAQGRSAELAERRVAALDQLRRVEIRAPRAGRVHQLAIRTVGGVARPGETLMEIVPDDERLVVEARIAPQDVDQAKPGEPVVLRLSAFSQRTTPELRGVLLRVSPDLVRDPRSGLQFYLARIAIEDGEVDRLGGLPLVPGMPVEAFVRTRDRTVLSYLVKPLADHFARAFRED